MSRSIITFILVLFFAISCRARGEGTVSEVFRAGSVDPVEAAETMAAMSSDRGTVNLHRRSGKIVVVDTPGRIERMRRYLRNAGGKKYQVRIDVMIAQLSRWSINDLGLGKGREVLSAETFDKLPNRFRADERTRKVGELMLVVESGSPAFINISQERLFGGTVTRREGMVKIVEPSSAAAGTALEVIPVLNDDGTVTVSVYPVLSAYGKDDIKYGRALITRVSVRPGETIFLGGADAVRAQAYEDELSFSGGAGWGPFSAERGKLQTCLFMTVNVHKKGTPLVDGGLFTKKGR
ncbi:MAG: hypothetical protein GF392_00220 [Candidatus Omnitrophica bacterium]|nr:hypothetical protein [Candidatus Omnitrophota bacterium]